MRGWVGGRGGGRRKSHLGDDPSGLDQGLIVLHDLAARCFVGLVRERNVAVADARTRLDEALETEVNQRAHGVGGEGNSALVR